MSSGKTVVILGGGTGGLVAANQLRKAVGREHRIVLVDRQADHLFAPSYLWLMLGQRRPEQVRKPLAALGRKGIEVQRADVTGLDLAGQRVQTSAGDLHYDYLVLSLGAETAIESIPGLAEAAYNLYDLDGATRLRDTLPAFQGGRVVVLVARLPYKCPAAPYDAAMLLDGHFRERGLRNRVELSVYAPEPQPMPVAGPELGGAVAGTGRGRGRDAGAEGHPLFSQWTVRHVEPASRKITFDNDTAVPYDLLVTVPPHRSPRVVRDSGLAGETGWVPVDPQTLETKVAGVYAIGDLTAIKLPNGMMLPKAGVFAHYQAEVVAHNVATAIRGQAPGRRFDGHGYCFLELGQGAAGYAAGNFYAEPNPAVRMRNPGRRWHWGKVAFEKWWLWHWF